MARNINAKLVLELLGRGMSSREIQRTRHIAPQSITKVRNRAKEKGISWNNVSNMEEAEVYRLLFPETVKAEEAFLKPDYDYIHAELQKTGVTMQLLYEEFKDIAAEKNLLCKSYTTFCRGYSNYVSSRNVTNHLEHKPGQVMEVDWSGAQMRLVDSFTGEVTKAYLFVACLPYSQMTYVEATLDMKQNTWLLCHVNAWSFFGGVAVRTVCDNLKTGVKRHPRVGEIELNEAYEALGRHYMTAIMPTQVRKPKQKASVEGAVGKIATAIVARLRNTQFETLPELNAAIKVQLDAYNARPFQKRDGSRKEIFEEVESAFLSPLPRVPFEVSEWYYGRVVNLNFHVSFKKNNYSVPHTLVGKKVDLKVTDSIVEIYHAGNRVASHPRFSSYASYRYATNPAHMPPEFIKAEWDEKRIMRWASDIGRSTSIVITKIFGSVQVKEQAYNPALAVLNLTKRYSEYDLEQACAYALTKTPVPRCKFIKSVLASKVTKTKQAEVIESGGYIRGASYYHEGEEGLC